MKPGPNLVIACPNCGALARVIHLISGNTFGASVWTDGKMVAPMLPASPDPTKCRACGVLYWLEVARQVGQYMDAAYAYAFDLDPSQIDPRWGNLPFVQDVTEDDLFQAIDAGLGATPMRERNLRIVAWWSSNDSYRDRAAKADVNPADRRIRNMVRLDELLDADDTNDAYMKVDIAREMGRFETALQLLAAIDDPETERVRTFFKDLCEQENRAVLLIPPELLLPPGWEQPEPKQETPCPYCGKPLRTPSSQQCRHCKADWHKKRPAD